MKAKKLGKPLADYTASHSGRQYSLYITMYMKNGLSISVLVINSHGSTPEIMGTIAASCFVLLMLGYWLRTQFGDVGSF
jgi:hypothetical protein